MTDYSELKRLAEAATPGKWDYEQDCLFFYVDGYTKHLMELCEGDDVDGIQQIENAKFIAAANPAAVLALIAECERLKARDKLHIKQFEELSDFRRRTVEAYDAKVSSLEGENEALRKDAGQ